MTGRLTARDAASLADTVLDRSVAFGYASTGFEIRRRLPGWPADPSRMDGKTVLVTGAASGIGLAAATGFARLGASVLALARNDERAAQAAGLIQASAGSGRAADVRPLACDVSSLASLRAFTASLREREPRLDVLVNNAGVMPDERTRTGDGVEMTFATHVLAPWVLIDELTPLLRNAAPSRVINVTSGGQYGQKIPRGDIESDHTRSPEQGADTIVWLGGGPEAIETTGLFWHDRRPRPATYPLGAPPDDDAARQELWDHVAALARGPAAEVR
ncbi:MAG TPA: SDR family NAD(P)-dependent oxidoreductase [Streptosporangiaceae bacterium]